MVKRSQMPGHISFDAGWAVEQIWPKLGICAAKEYIGLLGVFDGVKLGQWTVDYIERKLNVLPGRSKSLEKGEEMSLWWSGCHT